MAILNQIIIIFLVLYCVSVCYGQLRIVTPFSNTAGKKGQTVTMMTTVQKSRQEDYVGIYWFPPDPAHVTGIELFNEFSGDPVPTTLNANNIFSITASQSVNMNGNYTLTIRVPINDAEAMLVATTFEAKIILTQSVSTKAALVILATPECLEPTGNPEVLEGAIVNMLCNVTYFGYREPLVAWEDYNGQSTGSVQTTEANNHVATARREQTAAPADHNREFYCKVKYEQNTLSDEGRGTPQYQDMCAVRFRVVYGVTEAKVSPDPNTFQNSIVTIEQGQSMFCNASGSGTITYIWRCDNQQILVEGRELLIDEQFVRDGAQVDCECEASNMVQGQTRRARRPFFLVASAATSTGTTGASGSDGWKIAVGIIIPIVVIAILVGVVLYFCKRKYSDKNPVPTSDRLDNVDPGGPVIYKPSGPQNGNDALYAQPDKNKKKKKQSGGGREDSPMPGGAVPVMMSAMPPQSSGPPPYDGRAQRPTGLKTPVDSPETVPLKGILKTPTDSPIGPRKGILKTPNDSPSGTPRRPSFEGQIDHPQGSGPPRFSMRAVPLPHMGIPPPVAPKPSPRPKSMEGLVDKDSPKPSPRPRRPSLEGQIDKPTPKPRPPSRGDDMDDFQWKKKSIESLV